jgi:hypothetical protein
MSGRHRKPKTSAVTGAKIALTGAVLGGSGLALVGQASAASDSDWDQVARCESGGNWAINTGNGYQGGLQFAPRYVERQRRRPGVRRAHDLLQRKAEVLQCNEAVQSWRLGTVVESRARRQDRRGRAREDLRIARSPSIFAMGEP